MNQYVFEEERPVVDTKMRENQRYRLWWSEYFYGELIMQKQKDFRCRLKSNLGKELKMPISMDRFQNRFLN